MWQNPSCAGEGAAEPSGADEGLCEQRLSGTVTLPFLEVQLAEGTLVVHEEIGWGRVFRFTRHGAL